MNNNFFKAIKRDMFDSRLCCIGNYEVKAENVKRIIDAEDFYIKLQCASNIITIFGQKLIIHEKQGCDIYITGKINNIEFEVK